MSPRPNRSLWQRFKSGVRRLWRGESVETDSLGYPVHPLDLYDGIKGIEHTFWGMLSAWRRRGGKDGPQPRPAHHQFTDAHIRDLARLLERQNPFAQAIFSALRSYVLGEQGLMVEVTVREDVTPSDDDEQLQTDAQSYLDAYMDDDDWWARERELYVRCHRDGEGCVRFFSVREEGVRIRFVEPEQIVSPDATPEWSEGVRLAEGDAETLEAIWVQTGLTPDDGEEVPADEIHLIKLNVDRCIRRGVSDFASIADLLVKALDCSTSMVAAETVRQAIVFITQHEASAPADLDQFLAAQTDYVDRSSRAGMSHGGPSRDVPTQATAGVREVHLTGAQKLAAPPAGAVDSAVNAVNSALLSAASRYHMPLWVISGDASRNNALDLQAEGPFGRFIKDEQAWYAKQVRCILWRVLEIGVERGDLPAQTLVALDLAVSPQAPTEQRDPSKETERNKTLHEAGIIGKPTWATREGVDFQQEQDDIEREGGPAAGAERVGTAPAPPVSAPETPGDTPGEQQAAKASVGGLQAILALQTSVYKGEVPRAAAIANAEVVFGFTPQEAARLFPDVPPEKTADEGDGDEEGGAPKDGAPGFPGVAGESFADCPRDEGGHCMPGKGKTGRKAPDAAKKEKVRARAAADALEDNRIHGREAHVMGRPSGGSWDAPERKAAEAGVADALDALGVAAAPSYWVNRGGTGGETHFHWEAPAGRHGTLVMSQPAGGPVTLVTDQGRRVPLESGDAGEALAEKVMKVMGLKRKAVKGEAEEGEPTGPENVDPGVLADLFYGLYGDGAIDVLKAMADPEAVGEAWEASAHPRGKGGRFIPKGSAEAVGAAQETIRKVLGGDTSVKPEQVMEHLNILTVKQIESLAKEHGKTAPKLKREELISAVQQIMGQNVAKQKAAAPAPKAKAAKAPKAADLAAVEASVTKHAADLARESPSGVATVPDVVDRMRKDHPGMTQAQAHGHLTRMHEEDKVTLQSDNDPHLNPRRSELIPVKRGETGHDLMGYVSVKPAVPASPPQTDAHASPKAAPSPAGGMGGRLDAARAKKARLTGKPAAQPKAAPAAAGAGPGHVRKQADAVKALMAKTVDFGVTRQDLERGLDALDLPKMSGRDLLALARELKVDLHGGPGKAEVIDRIRRRPLELKEMLVQGAG